MPPERTDLVLSTDVPDVELGVLVGDCLNVEADCRNGGDILVELQLVKNGWKENVSQMVVLVNDVLLANAGHGHLGINV